MERADALTEEENAVVAELEAEFRGAALLAPRARGGALRARVAALVGAHLRALDACGGPAFLPVDYTASFAEAWHLFEQAWDQYTPRAAATEGAAPAHYREPSLPTGHANPGEQWRAALRRAATPLRARAGALERRTVSFAHEFALQSPAWNWVLDQVTAQHVVNCAGRPAPPGPPAVWNRGHSCRRALANPLLDPLVRHARVWAEARSEGRALASPWVPIAGLYALGVVPFALPDRLLVYVPEPHDPFGKFKLHASMGLWRVFDFGEPLMGVGLTQRHPRYDAEGFALLPFWVYVAPTYAVRVGPLEPPELPEVCAE